MSDPTLSDNNFKNEMGRVWTTLNIIAAQTTFLLEDFESLKFSSLIVETLMLKDNKGWGRLCI